MKSLRMLFFISLIFNFFLNLNLYSQEKKIIVDKYIFSNTSTQIYLICKNIIVTPDEFIIEMQIKNNRKESIIIDDITLENLEPVRIKNFNIGKENYITKEENPYYLRNFIIYCPRKNKKIYFYGIKRFGDDAILDLSDYDEYVKVRSKTKGISDSEKPTIVIDYPVLKNNFYRTEELFLTIEGKVTDNLGILNLKLNEELLAIHNGKFKKRVKLKIGKNTILLKATDINNNIAYKDFVIIRDELIIEDSFSDVDFVNKTVDTNSNSIAIVFGIENYRNTTSVSHAVNDADIFREYLIKKFGLLRENIYLRLNQHATKAEFDKVFSEGGWLDKRVKEGKTEIYFYYAGHGAPDIKQNKAYLIPYDGDPNYASQTGYEMDEIYSNLADLKAKSVTVFLDACFSGANRESEMLLADARPIFIEVEGPAAHGITVFSATSSKEISSAWPEKKHGLFSYFLMKGLQGKADLNKDKKLSVKELGDYIQEKVSEQAGYLDREQTPQMITDDENRILIKY